MIYTSFPFIITMVFLWLLTATPIYLRYVYFLQLKEYRFDRFRDFLHTAQGNAFLLEYSFLLRGIFGLALFSVLHSHIHIHTVFFIILCIDAAILAYRIYKNKSIKKPAFTIKAAFIVCGALFTEALLIWGIHTYNDLFIPLLLRFVIVIIVASIFTIPTVLLKRIYARLASKKLQGYPNLTVIGITGSYGKSSVKEFLSYILSQQFSLVKTPKNTNTEIGIAKFILKTDFTNIPFFICEMGAYRKGEIALISKMVLPDIGILTAINEQHLSLFGTIEATQQAKYELLRSIPADGYVVVNADNPLCTAHLDELACKTIRTYGSVVENKPDCLITGIYNSLEGTTFEGAYKGIHANVETPVIGAHHAYNIAPAIIVAAHLGMKPTDIFEACKTLPTDDIQGSLKRYTYGKAIIIDDSYNSNPQGFRSAIDVLALYPSDIRRIVITRGMLELGEQSDELHARMGEEIAFVADELIVIGKDAYGALARGVGKKYKTELHLIEHPHQLLTYMKSLHHKSCIILIENRIPPTVRMEIDKHKKQI